MTTADNTNDDIKEQALNEALAAHEGLENARVRRAQAFSDAARAGVRQARIAETVGLSESGVWRIIKVHDALEK